MQYTINEVLEGAGLLARLLSNEDGKRKSPGSIAPFHLRLVITHDPELNEVFKGAIFPGGGGGGFISEKHLREVRGPFRTSEEEVAVVKKKKKSTGRGRKGGGKSSRAKKGSRDEEDSDDSVVVVTGGSTRVIRDRDLVRRKDQNR